MEEAVSGAHFALEVIERFAAMGIAVSVHTEQEQVGGREIGDDPLDVVDHLDCIETTHLRRMDVDLCMPLAEMTEHRVEDRSEDEVIVLYTLGDDNGSHLATLVFRRRTGREPTFSSSASGCMK